jgi:hypothetical protein
MELVEKEINGEITTQQRREILMQLDPIIMF